MNKNYKENLKSRNINKTSTKSRFNESNNKEYIVKHNSTLLEYLISDLHFSRNNAKGLLSHHLIAINGAPTSQFDFPLVKEDLLIIASHPIKAKKRSELPIIFEDDYIIAIDKPYGLLSVASDKEKNSTAYRMVSDYLRAKDKKARIYVVHRLDKETSGVLIFAKNEEIKDLFQESWNELVLKRGYYAVVEGVMEKKSDRIINYLKMNNLNLMYVCKPSKDAYKCITEYKVLKENEKNSLLDINIETGRKNQIRVTLGSINHYVLGDDKYGEPPNPINRLCLHAYELDIINPITKKTYILKSKIPNIFYELVKK